MENLENHGRMRDVGRCFFVNPPFRGKSANSPWRRKTWENPGKIPENECVNENLIYDCGCCHGFSLV